MPYINHPRSNADRLKALVAANNKWNLTTDPTKRAITDKWHDALVLRLPLYQTAYDGVSRALSAQTTQTDLVERAATAQRLRLSHFTQILNMAIERGEFPPEYRAYYHLAISDGTVPSFDSYSDLALWTDHLVKGEADRLAAHPDSPAISLPSAADLTTGLSTLTTARNLQSPLKDAYDDALAALSNQNEEVDHLIKNLWDDIENFYRNEEAPSLRRRAREWGVIYAYRANEPIDPADPTPPETPTP